MTADKNSYTLYADHTGDERKPVRQVTQLERRSPTATWRHQIIINLL